MSSATVARPSGIVADARIVLEHVSWDTYERLLADDEGRRIPRMTYDQGVLELVTPSMPHEEDARTIGRIVDSVAATIGIPVRNVGSTTFRRQSLERGFEPDASFYVQHEKRIRGLREVDLEIDPPPDLIVEMEVSRTAIDKLPMFADMGIPEIWRCDGKRVTIHVLDGDHYRESPFSLALPMVSGDVLTRFLDDSRTMLSPDWFQAVSEWAREQRVPSS